MAIVKISDLPLVDQPVEGTDLFVVVQDNVTKKAYASDIQTYIGYDEFQTATSGQTVFNLTQITYVPGSNNLMVFVDGVNQYVGTSYLETDNNTVTFTQGLHVGALVKFSTVQTLSTVNTSSEDILFTQGNAGAVTRSVQSKLRDIVSVKDYGAVGDGVTDDTAAIQAAWDAIKSGNGTLFFPRGTYRCDSALNFTVNYYSGNHFHAIVGDCATIDFSNTALTTGNMITFGSGLGLFEEKSRFAMQGLSLIGPSLGSITPTSTPPHTLVGIFFNYAINLTLQNITVFNFYVGYKADFCFPISAISILSDNCYVGLQLVADITCSAWVGCSFKEGRYGVVIQPKNASQSIYGQTFVRCNFEGNDVGMVIDPLDGSGSGVRDIDVIDPYMEAITYDGFRVGRALDYNNATTTGADRNRNVYNFRLTGGLWDGQWGTSGHQPVLFHAADTADAPAGCVVDIPVQLSTASIGYTRKSDLKNKIDVYIGSSTVITDETQYQRKLTSLAVADGISAPSTAAGWAQIYVDSADGDLKVKFGDGTVKTIVTDT